MIVNVFANVTIPVTSAKHWPSPKNNGKHWPMFIVQYIIRTMIQPKKMFKKNQCPHGQNWLLTVEISVLVTLTDIYFGQYWRAIP